MAFFSTETRQANDDHLSMLSALGGQIGQFMERKRVEQGLRDSEERYRSVIAALDEGIVLVGAEGNLIASDVSAERILSRTSRSCWAPRAPTTESPPVCVFLVLFFFVAWLSSCASFLCSCR